MSIELPRLPFKPNALQPHMSAKTLKYHYGKHHKKYVETTNKLVKGTKYDKMMAQEIMFATAGKEPEIFNNATQALNHEFFWNCLSKKQRPSKELLVQIEKSFGGIEEMKEEFNETAAKIFGSGWAWLVRDKKGKIAIRALHNADNPMLQGEVPLLTCDVWEHAYYLDYQNKRPKYLKNFWSIVNWDFVELNHGLAKAGS